MDYHFNKIESDKRQCEQERQAKKQKQLRFKQTLEEQIEGNVSNIFNYRLLTYIFLLQYRRVQEETQQYTKGSQSPPVLDLKQATMKTPPCGRRNWSNNK
jgi:hypothetical protein